MIAVAALVGATWVALALWLLPDYGPTWDGVLGEHPLAHNLLAFYADGDEAFLDLPDVETVPDVARPRAREQHFELRLPGRRDWFQTSWLAALLAGASCHLAYGTLGVMSSLSAHHLVPVLSAAIVLVALAVFGGRRFGLGVGVLAALLLATSPRFFAHAFNNLKDVPETALYTLAYLAGFGALTRGGARRWVLTGVLAGMALAQKANALFLFPQLALLALAVPPAQRTRRWAGAAASSVLTALAVYVAVSPMYWHDPLGALRDYVGFMSAVGNTLVAQGGAPSTGMAAASIVDPHGVLHVLWTTPLPLLALAFVGWTTRGLGRAERALLVLGVAVPVGRTLLPGMRNFDGVRHLLEFMPLLCLAAALGTATLVRGLVGPGRGRAVAGVLLGVAALLPGALATARTHPNGIAYYNALVGGAGGAQARGVRGATDYWGNTYWQGLAWLGREGTHRASLLVPVAPHVAAAAEPVRLRADIALLDDRSGPPRRDLYLMFVTRPDWYPASLRGFLGSRRPAQATRVHTIQVDGATLLEIHHVPGGPEAVATYQHWRDEVVTRRVDPAFKVWLADHLDAGRHVVDTLRRHTPAGLDDTVAQLRAALPPEFHAALPSLVRFMARESEGD